MGCGQSPSGFRVGSEEALDGNRQRELESESLGSQERALSRGEGQTCNLTGPSGSLVGGNLEDTGSCWPGRRLEATDWLGPEPGARGVIHTWLRFNKYSDKDPEAQEGSALGGIMPLRQTPVRRNSRGHNLTAGHLPVSVRLP